MLLSSRPKMSFGGGLEQPMLQNNKRNGQLFGKETQQTARCRRDGVEPTESEMWSVVLKHSAPVAVSTRILIVAAPH